MAQRGRGQARRNVRVVAALTATALAATSTALLTMPAPASAAAPSRDVWVVTAPTATASAQAVSIARLTSAGDSAGAAIALPTVADGTTKPLTLGGTETTTGVLARSVDGKSVTFAGYSVAPGVSVGSSAPRGVALVDASGTVDTSTTLANALTKSAVRGAVTNDGTGFWVSGDGDDASPKRSVVYQGLAAIGAPAQLWSSDDDQYKKKGGPIKAYGGSLWFGSDNKGALYRVSGPPATPTSATLTSIASTTALDYALIDRDASIPGVDTLYVAVSAGIEKWSTTNGTSWTKVGTSALSGVRSLDARSVGDHAEIYAVVGTGSANTLHRIADTAAPAAPATLADATIATAPSGTAFRGVAFAPAADGSAPDSSGTTPSVTVTPPTNASVGDTVTYTAAVGAGGSAATAGSVTFYDGTTALGTAPVGPTGIATLSVTQALGGSRAITAWYSGSDGLLPTTSSPATATVGRLATTTVAAPASVTADYSSGSTSVTVTVAGAGGGGVTPTGSVTLAEAGTTVGTGALANGAVTISLTALGAGAHTLVATYGGSTSFDLSTSAPVSVTINPAATTTTLAATNATVALGATLTTTVAVANTVNSGSTYRPTGAVDVLEGSTVVGSGTLSSSGSSSVTLPAAVLTTGSHTFTARYNGNANLGGSTAAVPLTVTVASSTVSALTVTPSSGTIYLGQQQVTVTGTVTGLPAGGAAPTGTVDLRNGATSLAQVPVAATGGFTVLLPADQAAGSYALTASYGGDATYTASQSASKSLTITAGGSTVNTSATIALSAPGVAPGDPVRATATVTNGSNSTALVGYVRFSVDGTAVGDAKLTAASPATTPPSATAYLDLDTNLAAGDHTITAKYLGAGTSGSAGFKPSDAASATLTLEAAQPVDTSVTVDPPTAANPVTYGAANAVTVHVSPVSGDKTVTGTVQLRDGDAVIGSGQLSGGALTLSLASLLPGDHRLTASYVATGSFNAGQSTGAVTVHVDPASTTTALTLTTSAVLYGAALKPTVKVSNASGTGVIPTGTVTILEGSTVLVTGTLTSGSVTLSLPTTLASGSHTLHAVYTPGSGFAASESAADVAATVVGTAMTSTGFNPSEFYVGSARPTITFTVSSLQPGRGVPTGVVAVYTSSNASTAALLGYGTLDSAGKTTITLSAELPRSGASADDDKLKYKSITASYSGAGTDNPIEDVSATVRGGGDDDDDEGLEVKTKGSAIPTSTVLTLASADLGPEESTTAHVAVTAGDGSTPSGGYVQVLVDPDAYGTSTALYPACFAAEHCVEVPVTAGGIVDLPLPVLEGGDHTVTARYLAYQASKSAVYYGASAVTGDSTAVLHVDATKATVEVGLVVPNVEVGTASVATVTVTGTAGVPAGAVELLEGTRSLGTAELTDGQAEVDLGRLSLGLHPIKASYAGAAKYGPADSAQVQHSVFGHPVEISATAPSSCRYGLQCAMRITVDAPTGMPAGTVRLLERGDQLASAPYGGTAVTLQAPATWAVGSHSLTAVFSPTSEHAAASSELTVTVTRAEPTVLLALSRSTAPSHTRVLATVTVKARGVVPNGTVTLTDGTRPLASLTLAQGVATYALPAALAVGRHQLRATYAAGPLLSAAASPSLTLTLTKAATTSRLRLSTSTIRRGGSTTLTAITASSGFTPVGTVRFYDGRRYLGQAVLRGGKATFVLRRPAAGTHRLTVRYVGDASAAVSSSAAVTLKVRRR